MFDTGFAQDYARAAGDYARGLGSHAKVIEDYAQGLGVHARAIPSRWPPTLTYEVTVRDQTWWRFLAAGIGLGVAASWFLLPSGGRRNRAALRNRMAHLRKVTTRDLPEAVERKADYMGGKVTGLTYEARRVAHLDGREQPPDLDQFIAHKVESEVFGRPDVPKGRINVDSVDGVVTVRGTVENRDVMRRIVRYIEGVDGVRDVVNLMKTPAEIPLASTDPRR